MDLIDFRGLPDKNFKYILHIKDHFTRFSWAYPLSSKRTNVVALKLFELFTEIGPPTILQSDNGGEFTSEVIKSLSKLWNNLKIINGRPRHPQSQGLIERSNCEIGKLLGKWMESFNNKNWNIGLQFVLWAINTTTCRSTGKTPYQLVYGSAPRGNLGFLHALQWTDSVLSEENIPENVIVEQDNEIDVCIIYCIIYLIIYNYCLLIIKLIFIE